MQVSFIFGYSMKLQSVVNNMVVDRAITITFSTPLQNTLVHDLTVKVCTTTLPEWAVWCTQILPYAHQLCTKPHIMGLYLLSVVHSKDVSGLRRNGFCRGQAALSCPVCIQAA